MAKFDLTPSTFDKLKGNTILVKRDELEKFADFCKEKIKSEEELKNEVKTLEKDKSVLEKENQKLKRKLNRQILDEEVGKNSKLSQLDKENKELKKQLLDLQEKYKRMENLYLKKISELQGGCNTKDLKNEVSGIVKETIRKEFTKLQEPIFGSEFIVEI